MTGNRAPSNSRLRTFFECLLNGMWSWKNTMEKRNLLGRRNPPFLLSSLNEWNNSPQKPQFIQGLIPAGKLRRRRLPVSDTNITSGLLLRHAIKDAGWSNLKPSRVSVKTILRATVFMRKKTFSFVQVAFAFTKWPENESERQHAKLLVAYDRKMSIE